MISFMKNVDDDTSSLSKVLGLFGMFDEVEAPRCCRALVNFLSSRVEQAGRNTEHICAYPRCKTCNAIIGSLLRHEMTDDRIRWLADDRNRKHLLKTIENPIEASMRLYRHRLGPVLLRKECV